MKSNKKLLISLIILMPVLVIGTTLVYSASMGETTTSQTQVTMNPFEFIDQCQASGGLVFAWDNGYGCDYLDGYDVICDNSGVCGEGFVAESDPQESEVAGRIFVVGLHTSSYQEPIVSFDQGDSLLQNSNSERDEDRTSNGASNRDEIKAYCDSVGGTFIDEADRWGCDQGNGEITWCSEKNPCSDLSGRISNAAPGFGTLTPVDATFLQLFILKPGNTQFSMLAGSNQLYNDLAIQVADGKPMVIAKLNNYGIFRLESNWGLHEYEGLMFPITQLSYLLPDLPNEAPVSKVEEQVDKPEPTEQVILMVSPKQEMNCRYGPGTHYAILTPFRANTQAIVLSKNLEGDWYFVELEGGARCWAWGDGLLDVSNLDDVVVITGATDDSDGKGSSSDRDENPVTGGDIKSPDIDATRPPKTKTPPPPPACLRPPCEGINGGGEVVTDPPPLPCIGSSCDPFNPGTGTVATPPPVD